jgi:hypothetical protein
MSYHGNLNYVFDSYNAQQIYPRNRQYIVLNPNNRLVEIEFIQRQPTTLTYDTQPNWTHYRPSQYNPYSTCSNGGPRYYSTAGYTLNHPGYPGRSWNAQ